MDKTILFFSIEEITSLAEFWARENYQFIVIIDEIIPISDGLNICAYCISYKLDDKPYGYVVIDSNRYALNCILEFCLSGESIFKVLQNNAKYNDNENTEKIIYRIGSFNYAILTGECYYCSTGEQINDIELESLCEIYRNSISPESYLNYREGFYSAGTITASGTYTYQNLTNIAYFMPSLMIDFPSSQINCTPTAATNIISYYKEQRGFTGINVSRQNLYSIIVSASGWNSTGTTGMSIEDARDSLHAVVNAFGYDFDSSTYLFDLWSDWTRDIYNDFPVLTAVYGYRQDNNGNWIYKGHSIVAVGYRQYSSGPKYIRVLDGWNATVDRFIWFNSSFFTSVDGICIKVS